MKRAIVVAALAVLVAGCFPTTVSVAPDGRIALVREEGVIVFDLAKDRAVLVAKAAADTKAAWVQFSADGGRLLYVLARENGPGTLYVVSSAGGEAKELYKSENPMAWARWSPDGKYVSVGEVSMQAKGDLGNLVAIKAISTDTGEARDVASDTALIHAWTKDSKAIVAVVVKRKIGDGALGGTLTKIALDGQETPIAEVVAGKDLTLDVSPDGASALVTASAAAEAGKDAGEPEDAEKNAIFLCALDGKAPPKQIAEAPAACAFFSPDGKRILCVRNEEKARLTALDRDGKNEKTLAKDVLSQGEGFDSARYLPVWASNDTVLFWKSRVVVGPGGKAVTTLSVTLDGAAPVNVQVRFDALAEKAK